MTIDILLADDHVIVRDGLRMLLESRGEMKVVGTASDGREAVMESRRLRPHVVVMDISMPTLNGIEAARAITEALPDTKVLILSMEKSPEHVFRALQAGARGYLLKGSAGAELVAAVQAVHGGRRYLGHEINETVVAEYINKGRPDSPLENLSARERSLLQLIAEGHSNGEAAKTLCLSIKTVETYRSRLMQKLGLNDVTALVKFAIEHGLTDLKS
ncbi:MAG TPA: response regulator transcription factor [Verrucomicrobiae bacterium]|nr:response regulator transcription factor [Verrucomicrobiae bacterium]